MSKKKERV
uniref:Uncharacterized protein n=1 Tax=Rhizophora mucronata TaxID=61149 RepID=A0A2P2N176_RHIMU